MIPSYHNPRIAEVQRVVSAYYGLPMDDMLCPRRWRWMARPRQIAMYLSRALTGQSLPVIGSHFGGRDHTTVIHAIRAVESLRAKDSQVTAAIHHCSATLAEVVAERLIHDAPVMQEAA